MMPRWKALLLAAGIGAAVLPGCRKSENPEPSAKPTGVVAARPDQRPPFGLIDTPQENDTLAAGAKGAGWALDDSGVAKIEVSFDNNPSFSAEIGQPFAGVHDAYPGYPDSDKAGFRFTVPSVAAGPHLLIVTITGKDGGKTDLRRHLRIQ
jgi:hypothetical protein